MLNYQRVRRTTMSVMIITTIMIIYDNQRILYDNISLTSVW